MGSNPIARSKFMNKTTANKLILNARKKIKKLKAEQDKIFVQLCQALPLEASAQPVTNHLFDYVFNGPTLGQDAKDRATIMKGLGL